ncbi:DUF6777 domain-containing protein [Streptomyces sp. NBC_00620]|uniref:DUF6777 domain-containing protein n=1 Tax=unclassified Streptomyces TaxID=2593676 RepID=UPI002253F9E0|nr:DUF6777 domain-containing protein [Streptomyces sp. NBC_00620]MCX4977293.1 hypothetical protein [Streptomyces sp. NBC_00620]WUC08652.1 hypothetical protein OG256_01590 [Streptomyces sp. NBC_00564]
MSVEPPSSGRPTGPPSGPLSGPSQPGPSEPSPTQPSGRTPSGPPPSGAGGSGAGGSGAGGSGAGGPSGPSGPGEPGEPGKGPDRPWWKSAPRVALITGVVVAAVVLGLVFTRDDSGSDTSATGGEVFLQAASKSGPDPFTESTANDSSTETETPSTSTASESTNVTQGVDGSAPGLYGGTRNVSSCDVEKQIKFLQADPAKNSAFASVVGLQTSQVPGYLRALTPMQLRYDTRVTNHGYRDGAATSYQAVLQAGTAALVDDHGVPRVRCACGNPLGEPVPQKTTPKQTGDSWPSYRTQNVVVVSPSTTVINIFVIFDPDNDEWIARHKGDKGHHDEKTDPPAHPPFPSASVSSPTPNSPSPCVSSAPGTTPSAPPSGSSSPCTSPAPSSSSPSAPTSSESSPSESDSDSESPPSEPPTTASDSSSSSAPGLASSATMTETTSASVTSASASLSAPESSATSPGL